MHNASQHVFHKQTAEATGKELEQYRELSSQVKRRRMLQFESEGLEAPLCNDDVFLRSKVDANSCSSVRCVASSDVQYSH